MTEKDSSKMQLPESRGSRLYDLFISFSSKNVEWASWVYWIAADVAGYKVFNYTKCIPENREFQAEINACLDDEPPVFGLLSQALLKSKHCLSEIDVHLSRDPGNEKGNLVLLKVADCKPTGRLGNLSINSGSSVIGLSEMDAARLVLERLFNVGKRSPREQKGIFDKLTTSLYHKEKPRFPGVPREHEDALRTLLETEFDEIVQRKNSDSGSSPTREALYGVGSLFYHDRNEEDGLRRIERSAANQLLRRCMRLQQAIFGSGQAPRTEKERSREIFNQAATARWLCAVAGVANGLEIFDTEILLTPLVRVLTSEPESGDVVIMQFGISRQLMEAAGACAFAESPGIVLANLATCVEKIGEICRLSGANLVTYNKIEEARKKDHKSAARSGAGRNKYNVSIYFSDARGSYSDLLGIMKDAKINLESTRSFTLKNEDLALAELVVSDSDEIGAFKEKIRRLWVDNRTLEVNLYTMFVNGQPIRPPDPEHK